MNRTRQFLALAAGGIGIAAALLGAPTAGADPDGSGGPNNPLLPGCETTGGDSVTGEQTEDCAQITATPNDLVIMGGYGSPGFGYGF